MGWIVTEVLDRLRYRIKEYEAEIILPETWPKALGYSPWVEEIWVNYVSNALKYGTKPPRVELGAEAYNAAQMVEKGDTGPIGEQVCFWVRDNGDGLSPEEQERLFMPFERLHQARVAGHGLGLSIVQRVVQKLGGTVGVKSEGLPGQGCEFYFTLPAAPPD
jgi:signal transduction histidine kinase